MCKGPVQEGPERAQKWQVIWLDVPRLRTPIFLSRWSYLSVLMKLIRMSVKAAHPSLPQFRTASSLFTSNSFSSNASEAWFYFMFSILSTVALFTSNLPPDLYTLSSPLTEKTNKITCLDPASGSPLKLPFQPDAHPFHPGYDSNHPVSRQFLQFLDTAIWHTFSPPELWKHKTPVTSFFYPWISAALWQENQPQEYGS